MLVATAGHVDHGKTSLINALTGVNTDQLPEEKKRGLTIDLGFAFTSTPDGSSIGFVDVPGHSRFIRNMAAGVAAIDIALLVVAADDGVMPQTEEHISILDLFGISQCIVAITKIDLVDQIQIAKAKADIQEALKGTAIKAATFFEIDNVKQHGIEALQTELFSRASQFQFFGSDRYFRLAIDRAFVIQGAGTVVTGSVFSGVIHVGDTVNILPGRQTTRIRSLRVNGKVAESSRQGERVALNLANVDRATLTRGEWVTAQEQQTITTCIDVQIRVLHNNPQSLKHWSPVHVHAGSATTLARVALYQGKELAAGQSGFAQLVLDNKLHIVGRDRFVLRDHSASRTIAGGYVLDAHSQRRRSFRKNRIPDLLALDHDDQVIALQESIDCSARGIPLQQHRISNNLLPEAMTVLLEQCTAHQFTDADGELRLINATIIDDSKAALLTCVDDYHQQNPQATGIDIKVLQAELKLVLPASIPIFTVVLAQLLNEKTIERIGARLKVKGHSPQLNAQQQALLDQLVKWVGPTELKPPAIAELAENIGVTRAELLVQIESLVQLGHLVKVRENRVYHPKAIETLAELATSLCAANPSQGFDAKSFNSQSGIGRNVTIDVLEYFDRTGLTKRLLNHRVLRN